MGFWRSSAALLFGLAGIATGMAALGWGDWRMFAAPALIYLASMAAAMIAIAYKEGRER